MSDLDRLEKALTTIAHLWPLTHPTGPPPIRLGKVGTSSTKPLPIPTPVVETLDGHRDIRAVLETWAKNVIHAHQLAPHIPCPTRVPHRKGDRLTLLCGCGTTPGSATRTHPLPATNIPALATFLTTHANWLATNPLAVEQINRTATTIRHLADPRGARQFVGPCPTCGHDLRAYPGETARCTGPGCSTELEPEAQRTRLVKEAEDKLYTASEIVGLAHRLWDYPVTNVHITRWKNAGRLIPHGAIGKRDLYRVGDVADLAKDHHEARRK